MTALAENSMEYRTRFVSALSNPNRRGCRYTHSAPAAMPNMATDTAKNDK